MGSDERAIRDVHSTWIGAVNAGDLVCLLSWMADDAVFLNPGQAALGRDGFPAGFSTAHQQARINCVSELEDVKEHRSSQCVRRLERLSPHPRLSNLYELSENALTDPLRQRSCRTVRCHHLPRPSWGEPSARSGSTPATPRTRASWKVFVLSSVLSVRTPITRSPMITPPVP